MFIAWFATDLGAQNTYHKLAVADRGRTYVVCSTATSIPPGSAVLLHQWGGATAVATGASAGRLTDLRGSGRYAVNRVTAVSGDTLWLADPLPYDFEVAFSQLVVDPLPGRRRVDTPQTAQPFDGTTGGVLFLAARQKLLLTADLVAQAVGFRGGAGSLATSNCDRFTRASDPTYAAGDWRGAHRGEGVSSPPPNAPAGRAASTSGGGGGNDHNAGGGGGANVANGGDGATTIESGLFNFRCRGSFPGFGGRELPADPERLYFGGGGGAGHANNSTEARGGNGGGLIVLWAPTLHFAGSPQLDVAGEDGPATQGDGAGGGGAAGSVLLLAEELRGKVRVGLNGGRGGDVNNGGDRCFGPGGGGSGGWFVFAGRQSDFLPTIMPAGGQPGRRLNSTSCRETDNPGQPGQQGKWMKIDNPRPVSGIALSHDLICSTFDLTVTDRSEGADAVEWEILPDTEGINATPTAAGGLRLSFQLPTRGDYRITQSLLRDGLRYAGDTVDFRVWPSLLSGTADPELFGDSLHLIVRGAQHFDSIRYEFGDGTELVTRDTSVGHRYAVPGTYPLRYTLLSRHCDPVLNHLPPAVVPEFARARIEGKDLTGCAPANFRLADISTGGYSQRRWELPGSTTPVAYDQFPEVTYPEPGRFRATLILVDGVGPDTATSIPVFIAAPPEVDFSFSTDTLTVAFTNRSTTEADYFWDFGDGNTSTEPHPTHTYATGGEYAVKLLVDGSPCRDSLVQNVSVDPPLAVTDLHRLGVRLSPNPTVGPLHLSGPATPHAVFDLRGRRLPAGHGETAFDLSPYPAGIYLVQLRYRDRIYTVRVRRR